MRTLLLLASAAFLLAPASVSAQIDGSTSDPQAVKAMQQMLDALGGAKWLAIRNVYSEGRTSGFYQGTPTGSIGAFYALRTVPASGSDPGLLRVEYTKKKNVVDILLRDQDWEITYKGKRLLPLQEYGTIFRRRDHSLDEAVRVWWHAPGTVLFWGGEKVSERHLVDEVTLLSADNDNITIQMDVNTHLPFRVSFQWRDPLYKDQNTEAEEYADWHPMGGLPTALNLSTYHNGDMPTQQYLTRVEYNVTIPPDAFNVDATVAKIVK